MNELIKITTGGQGFPVVSARDLHEFLEVKTKFATWIDRRIVEFGFVENQDYTIYSQIWEKGRPEVEYALTLDMAKELSMVERNSKGKQARRYFIEKEKELHSLSPPAPPSIRRIGSSFLKPIRIRTERGQLWVNADDMAEADYSNSHRFAAHNKALDKWITSEIGGKPFLRGVEAFSQLSLKDLVIDDNDGLWLQEKLALEYARHLGERFPDYLNDLLREALTTSVTPLTERIRANQLDLLATELVGLVQQKLLK